MGCGSDACGSPNLGVLAGLSRGVFTRNGHQRKFSKLGRILCDKYGPNTMKFTDFIALWKETSPTTIPK